MTGMRSSERGEDGFGIFSFSLSSYFSRHCEEQRDEAIHLAAERMDCFVATAPRNDGSALRYSATSAFMCSTASTKSSLNSCTTAPADFTLSIRPTPWPTK